jgi:hypothetical protein
VLQEILGCDVEYLLFLGLRLQPAFVKHSHEASDAAQPPGSLSDFTTADRFLAVGID